MKDDDSSAFPPPRARRQNEAAPYRSSAAPSRAAGSSGPTIVHRPDAPVPEDAESRPPKLTQDEVRAMLDVESPGYRINPWIVLAGSPLLLVRRFLPWPVAVLAAIAWAVLVVREVRRYIATGRRWS